MNQNKKLKLWVKIVLYITIVGAISIFVFFEGVEIGKRYAQENMESTMTETDMLVMDEAELEEMEEEVIEKPYVIDPLILVNKKHRLPDDYEVELKTMYDKVNRAAKEAYGPLNDMLAAGRAEGLAFEICSSYRDITVQERLFQEDVDVLMEQGYTYEEAYAVVERETMPPGHSEHSTGLAFDIVSLGYQMLDISFCTGLPVFASKI